MYLFTFILVTKYVWLWSLVGLYICPRKFTDMLKKLIKEEKLKYSWLILALHPELSVVLYFFFCICILVSITAKGQSVSFNKQVLLFVC